MDSVKAALAKVLTPKTAMIAALAWGLFLTVWCLLPGEAGDIAQTSDDYTQRVTTLINRTQRLQIAEVPPLSLHEERWSASVIGRRPAMRREAWHYLPEIAKEGESDPPQLLSTQPRFDDQGAEPKITVFFHFNEGLLAPQNIEREISFKTDPEGAAVPFLASLEGDQESSIAIRPSEALAFDTAYHVALSSFWKDKNGNRVTQAYELRFRTKKKPEAAPTPVQAPEVKKPLARIRKPVRVRASPEGGEWAKVRWTPDVLTKVPNDDFYFQVIRLEAGVFDPNAMPLFGADRLPHTQEEYEDHNVEPGKTYDYFVQVMTPLEADPQTARQDFALGGWVTERVPGPADDPARVAIPEKPVIEYKSVLPDERPRPGQRPRRKAMISVTKRFTDPQGNKLELKQDFTVPEDEIIGQELSVDEVTRLGFSQKSDFKAAGIATLDFRTGLKLVSVEERPIPDDPLKRVNKLLIFEDTQGQKWELDLGQSIADARKIQ